MPSIYDLKPAFLRNMGRALPKGEFLPVPFLLEIRIGRPLAPRGTREEVVSTPRAAVVALASDSDRGMS